MGNLDRLCGADVKVGKIGVGVVFCNIDIIIFRAADIKPAKAWRTKR